jgi:putative transcriptional regulator
MADPPTFLSGKLLLAMPGMADPRFERAVIAMCVHDENGAIGIGIGHKRAGISFRGLLKQLDIEPDKAPTAPCITAAPSNPGAASSSTRPTGVARTLCMSPGRRARFSR